MVVARAKAKAPPAPAAGAGAGAAGRRGGGVRVGPAWLEGLPAAWPAGAAAVKVKWPAPGGALAHMLTGRWARGVTAVEPVAAGGTARWEPRDGNRFSLHLKPAGGRAERGVFLSVLYVSARSAPNDSLQSNRSPRPRLVVSAIDADSRRELEALLDLLLDLQTVIC